MRISATTQLCGILLHPARHTRSPAMHNAAFEALGLDAVYCAFDVAPAALGDAIAGARAFGVRQLAISLPHKEAVIAHVDELDETARRIGAVNTVTRVEDRLVGTNTDWLGAMRALEQEVELPGRRAVVLGAGGTARAVVFGLLERGADVTVLNRTRSKAEELVASLGAGAAGGLEDLAHHPHDVLVNTTRVGLAEDRSPVAASALHGDAVVMDAVYDPPETRLLRDARERGASTVRGKWMLVHQGAAQLHAWSGKQAPIEIMAGAFDSDG